MDDPGLQELGLAVVLEPAAAEEDIATEPPAAERTMIGVSLASSQPLP
jgi:hypothetical protein